MSHLKYVPNLNLFGGLQNVPYCGIRYLTQRESKGIEKKVQLEEKSEDFLGRFYIGERRNSLIYGSLDNSIIKENIRIKNKKPFENEIELDSEQRLIYLSFMYSPEKKLFSFLEKLLPINTLDKLLTNSSFIITTYESIEEGTSEYYCLNGIGFIISSNLERDFKKNLIYSAEKLFKPFEFRGKFIEERKMKGLDFHLDSELQRKMIQKREL